MFEYERRGVKWNYFPPAPIDSAEAGDLVICRSLRDPDAQDMLCIILARAFAVDFLRHGWFVSPVMPLGSPIVVTDANWAIDVLARYRNAV